MQDMFASSGLSISMFPLLFQLCSLKKKGYSCHRDSVPQELHPWQVYGGWETLLNSVGKGK